jgi:hypothetical protein
MNLAKCAQATSIMNNVKSGHYIRGAKFANYGSVVEDSIIAQQRAADLRLKELRAQKAIRLAKSLI